MVAVKWQRKQVHEEQASTVGSRRCTALMLASLYLIQQALP